MGNDLISAAGLIKIIDESRQNALKKVNEELINMYWKVGEFLSRESESAQFGDAYIDGISNEIREINLARYDINFAWEIIIPACSGFSMKNLCK